MRRTTITILGLAFLLWTVSGVALADHRETADILDQGDGPVLVEDGARLVRTPDGLSVKIGMPTPEPNTYTYPTAGVFSGPGHPEGFTLWAFVFNFPAGCTDPCDSDDIGNTPAQGTVFFVAGHLVGGSHLSLSGHVSAQETPVDPALPSLHNPIGAEVHLAVAPHGGLDVDMMPAQIKTPTGPPTVWWIAQFK